MIDEYAGRFEMLVEVVDRGTALLSKQLALHRSERCVRRKFDGSLVTDADREISEMAWTIAAKRFPGDSFDCEEDPRLKPGAEWSFHLDPVDPTSELVHHDHTNPGEHPWASVLVSYSFRKRAVMFGLGIPARKEIFIGTEQRGVFLNGDACKRPTATHGTFLSPETWYETASGFSMPWGYAVAPAVWIILTGRADAGSHPIDRPYEANCILAAIRCINARVTDEFEHECHVGDECRGTLARAVWSLPPSDHAAWCKKARELMDR